VCHVADAIVMNNRALLSLVYHDSMRRGRAGEPGFADWARRAQLLERFGTGHILRRIPSARRALNTIGPGQSLRDQAALHAWSPTAAPHAGYFLAQGPAPNQVFLSASQSLEDAAARAFTVPHAADIQWCFTRRQVDASGVTRVGVLGYRVVKRTSPLNFAHYVRQADPRNWHTTANVAFKESYPCHKPDHPRDRPPEDTPKANLPAGPWSGRLFEFVRLEVVAGDDLTEFRNILEIDFAESPGSSFANFCSTLQIPSQLVPLAPNTPVDTLVLRYRLNECLTSNVYGIENLGGIDVDEGQGGVAVAESGDLRVIVVAGEKDVRFSRAAAFSEELNLLAFPFLLLWIQGMILGSLD
jgi:hypothetical protein